MPRPSKNDAAKKSKRWRDDSENEQYPIKNAQREALFAYIHQLGGFSELPVDGK